MLEHQQEDDQQENQGQMFNSIDRLEGPGIGAPDIKKLKDAGHHTMESVCHSTKKELAQIKGISDNKIDKIIEAAFKMLGTMGFTERDRDRAAAPGPLHDHDGLVRARRAPQGRHRDRLDHRDLRRVPDGQDAQPSAAPPLR